MDSPRLIAEIMSAAVAPVFLITSAAMLLNCMSLRYGRVIDRTRTLLRDGKMLYGQYTDVGHLENEITNLYKRAKRLRVTIILTTSSILFIVLAIMLIFFNIRYDTHIDFGPEACFAVSLLVLSGAMFLFIEDFATSLTSIADDINIRGYSGLVEKGSAKQDPS